MKVSSRFPFFLILMCLTVFTSCTANRPGAGNDAPANADGAPGGSGGAATTESENTNQNAPAKNDLPAESAEIESVYTDLAGEKCKNTESNEEEGGWFVEECPGISGFKLELTEGDLRQSINVIADSGKKWELGFPQNVSSAFSSLGDKAEWRVKKDEGQITPIALITRYNASENPEAPDKLTSYLVVTKFEGDSVCITDVVKPIPNANETARRLADASANKPCLQAGK